MGVTANCDLLCGLSHSWPCAWKNLLWLALWHFPKRLFTERASYDLQLLPLCLKRLHIQVVRQKKSEHMGTRVLFIYFYFDVRCRESRVRMGFNSTRCFFFILILDASRMREQLAYYPFSQRLAKRLTAWLLCPSRFDLPLAFSQPPPRFSSVCIS